MLNPKDGEKCGFETFFTGEGPYHDGVFEISKSVWKKWIDTFTYVMYIVFITKIKEIYVWIYYYWQTA